MASRYDEVLEAIAKGRELTRDMVVGKENPTDQSPVTQAEPMPWETTEPDGVDEVDEEMKAFLLELFPGTALDTVAVEPYVPFQDVPDDWGRGSMCGEPGYAESVTPYLF